MLAAASPATGAVRRPDLIVTSISDPPGTAALGGSFAVVDKVKNAGTARAGRSTMRFYLSADRRKNSGDLSLVGKQRVPALRPGRAVRRSATVTVPQTTPESVYFVLACADDLRRVREKNERNNCRASRTQVVVTAARTTLNVQKIGPPQVLEGREFDYSITVNNVGTLTARQVVVTDTLPAEGEFVSADPPVSPSTGVLKWTLGDLAPGASRALTLRWRGPDRAAFLFNSVTASAENADAASSTAFTQVIARTDTTLAIEKTGPVQASAGQELVYRITVTNTGNNAAAEVRLADTLPAQGEFVSSTPAGTPVASTLTLALGDIPAGQAKTVTVRWRAPAEDATLTNTAAASASNAPEETSTVQTFVDAPGGEPDPGVANSLLDRTAFLYAGDDPSQKEVAPGTIALERVALLRGTILDGSGAGLQGVRVTVLDHPEFGYTDTRADGGFDLVLNGGGQLNLNFEKDGYLPVQRTLESNWQQEQALEPVVMSALDAQVTTVDPDSTADFQVVQGSDQTDADGSRQATLLYPKGAGGEMVMPDGSTQPLDDMAIRATEYTVGGDGGAAMPGTLPPSSGFTYAVEFSVDEALAEGATSVRFDKPLINYTENFIGAPVGSPVPTGYYDRDKGRWLPSENGRVIKILTETGDRADLDTDGDGNPDTAQQYATLGISDAERDRLAALYDPGQELWRVEITHFTPWDHNWPYGPPPGAKPPRLRWFNGEEPDPCYTSGSIIECENQVLGESIPIVGTDFDLVYQSSRVPGYTAARLLNIPITGPELPPGLKGVRLVVEVAGRKFEKRWEAASASNPSPTNPVAANLSHPFVWDGSDAYGNRLQGRQIASITVGYVYELQYYGASGDFEESFAQFGNNVEVFNGRQACSIPGAEFFCGVVVQQTTNRALGAWDARAGAGLAGWTLDVHHAYDPAEKAVHRGDGTIVRGEALPSTLKRLSRFGSNQYLTQAAVAPNGTIYTYDSFASAIETVNPDGTRTHFAGVDPTTANCNPTGDGGPATQAILGCDVNGIVPAPDGSVYVLVVNTVSAGLVRKIAPDGTITTTAGSGAPPEYNDANGDGGPAIQAKIGQGNDLEIGPDGALYLSERRRDTTGYRARIRRIGPEGKIETIAGGGNVFYASLGSGKPARDVRLQQPYRIDFGPDGALYIPDPENGIVLRLGTDGIITRFAGTGSRSMGPDGVPAGDANIGDPVGVAVGLDGTVYIRSRRGRDRIRQVDGSGIIQPFVGFGTDGVIQNCPFPSGAEGPAGRSCMDVHNFIIETHPDGGIVTADGRVALYKVTSPLPGFGPTTQLIPSDDGTDLYEFTGNGRHVRTYTTLTGAIRYQFLYDADRRLRAVVDADGNTTKIERAADGTPTAVVAPAGQRTVLTTGAQGWLASATNPAGEATQIEYTPEGLLTKFTDALGAASNYQYDSDGRLTRAEASTGQVKTLTRTESPESVKVVVRTSLGRETTYKAEILANGDRQRTTRYPSGAERVTVIGEDGVQTLTTETGTKITTVAAADPRWGMRAPFVSSQTMTTPAGKTRRLTFARDVSLKDPKDPLHVDYLAERVTAHSSSGTRQGSTTYYASTRRIIRETPEGRRSETELDRDFRVASVKPDEKSDPIKLTYDDKGRVTRVVQGSISNSFAYDSVDRIVASTDASGAVFGFNYDPADRMTKLTLPSGNAYRFTYDAVGNPTSVVMPKGAEHGLRWTADRQDAGYDPPGAGQLTKTWNADGALTARTLVGGRTVAYSYDTANRPTAESYPEADVALGYAGNSGKLSSLSWTAAGDSPSHALSFTYDGFLTTAVDSTGTAAGKYEYSYGDLLFPTAFKLTSGADVVDTALAYDRDGLLTTLGPFSFTRGGPEGLPSRIADGTLDLQLTYDGLARQSGHRFAVAGQQKHKNDLTLNAAGSLAKKIETLAGGTAQTFDYRYDPDGQLTEVSKDGEIVERYAYDANGNRTSRQIGSGSAEAATYDASDRLTSLGGVTYSWNADGQLIERGDDSFSYSARGELLSANVGGTAVNYAYDGFRRRVSRTVGSNTYQYLYGNPENPFQITAARAPGGELTTYYYDDFGRVFAFRRAGAWFYVSTDQVGSPRLVVDATGSVVKRTDYDAYGVVVADSAPGFDLPIGFAGGLHDDLTGLVNFGFRDYDPRAGRWTNRDPARFEGGQGNLYAYSFNNPVQFRDPAGLGAWDAGWGALESVGVQGIGISGALYRGIGGEASISFGRKGWSVCVGTGVGVGGGLLARTAGPAKRTGLYTAGEISAGFGPLSITEGFQIDPCGELSQTSSLRGELVSSRSLESKTGIPFPQNFPRSPRSDRWSKGSWKAGASAKLSARACYSSLD